MKKIALALFFVFSAALAALADQPASSAQTYPQVDISGFKKWEHKEVSVDNAKNFFTGISQLGYSPLYSGGPWQERLQLKILGQLSENLSVTYDLDQEPETPERFDVKVKYYNNELTFGDINANFSGNEFVSASKFLNGVMLTAKDSWYDILAVPSAKLKSQTQGLTSQKGSNTRGPYNLGHGSIVEGSEQVQLSGNYLRKDADYTIDYFEGKITFNRILSQTDEFKYSYEYTNVLDLFFPTLSKRDFLGFQSRFTIDPERFGKPAPKEAPVVISEREIFPTAGSAEAEIMEGESSGLYRLKQTPLINFSETLTFMGTQLKKNDDYIIRYDTGEIKLLTRFLPSSEEALVAQYQYYATSQETEAIAGIGSHGPYHTKHYNLVPESERLEVDGKLFVRDLDYTIKYPNGEIVFGLVIGPTSQIKIGYRYNVTALPPTVTSKFPKELKLGVTYLKESAKQAANAPTASVVEGASGAALIAGNFLMRLNNRPLPTGEALTVTLNQGGVTRTLTKDVDYTVPTVEVDPATGNYIVVPSVPLAYVTDHTDPSDGFATGTLYFLNHSINATNEISVTYFYQKNVVDKYSGSGNGSRGPYFLRNTRSIVPGSETVQVWEQGSSAITTYTRNASFDATAGETGYSINYNPNNPSITFNNPLGATKNFQVIYQYVPVSAATGGNISQAALGLDGSFKIGDIFKINSSYAKSDTDQVFTSITTVEPPISGNGSKLYPLHSPANIIEGSEKILVNNKLVNRDIDYFITYSSPGSFNFFYITPTSLDAISVEYKYQSLAGLAAETKTKTDYAYRLGAETKLFGDTLTINGSTKKIGFDFSPLGGTAIGIGSNYEEYNLNFKPAFQSFYTNYSYKFNQNPIGTTRQTFLRSYDNSASTGINPGGLAKIDFGYRSFFTLDDPLAAGAAHTSDNLALSYSGSVAPGDWQRGPLTLNQKYDFSRTNSKNHVVNVNDPNRSTQNTNYYHAGGGLKFTDRVGLSCDFQSNEPITLGSQETETAHTRAVDNAYNLSLDLTAGFLQKWLTRVSIMNHTDTTITPTAESHIDTKNETYHMDVTPFTILTGSLDHNRQERTSYIAGGANPLSLRTSGLARVSPFAWLTTGVNYSRSDNVPETGAANRSTSRTKGWDADYSPLSLPSVKLSSHFAYSDQVQIAPSGTQIVTTLTNTFSQAYTLNLTLIPVLPLTFGYNQEDYNNKNNSTTAPVTTETSNNTITVSTSLSLPRLPQLSLSADYSLKISNIRKPFVDSKPKSLLNGKASYQLFSWGTINYELSDEINKGEVQAGAVPTLDYKKTTQAFSLNITIPVDNPALKNFTIVTSYKQVDYKNNIPGGSGDNFKAHLLSFEGTLNF